MRTLRRYGECSPELACARCPECLTEIVPGFDASSGEFVFVAHPNPRIGGSVCAASGLSPLEYAEARTARALGGTPIVPVPTRFG